MLTPVFECQQDEHFVVVRIFLSALCKVSEAIFNIAGCQLTFHCRPYYLRLRFLQGIAEGRGERATYDLETNVLTVYVPKEVPGEHFTQLDNPGFLIATEKQRAEMFAGVVAHRDDSRFSGVTREGGRAAVEDAEEEEEEDETEFVQTLPSRQPAAAAETATAAPDGVTYGFADAFSGLFAGVDVDIVREMIELPTPESTSAAERRRLRLLREDADFDEDAMLIAFEDADDAVGALLRYVPAHMRDFQRALQSEGITYAQLPSSAASSGAAVLDDAALEEDESTLLPTKGPVDIWKGNIGSFTKPLIEEISEAPVETSASVTAPAEVQQPASPHAAVVAGTRLAVPRHKPSLSFSREENEVMIRLKYPRLLFPPPPAAVAALTADLLFAEAYDDLFTAGSGCSESLWNICTLSPALTYLDPADNIYDACRFFTRRLLIYPLTRHFAVAQRVFAVVGTRLLLGKAYVVRALLRVRMILSHSEHKHILATIFLDPMIAYWMNVPDADERLTHMALELHEQVARTSPVTVKKNTGGRAGSNLLTMQTTRTLEPLTVLTLGLPISDD